MAYPNACSSHEQCNNMVCKILNTEHFPAFLVLFSCNKWLVHVYAARIAYVKKHMVCVCGEYMYKHTLSA